MELPQSTDVFVVGGGPAGLAAAIAARRRGLRVTVADHGHPPVDKACGEGIMPDGLAAARALGIQLEGKGQPFRGIRFCHGDERVQADFPQGPGFGIRRTTLHRILVEEAERAGARLLWRTGVTGMDSRRVYLGAAAVEAAWVVGADGGNSRVRDWAGLAGSRRNSRRYGFRRHYPVAPWSEFMEIHWGEDCQLYITPTGPREICAVVISGDSRLRLDEALPRFPQVAGRLAGIAPLTPERGAVSATRRLCGVTRGRVALIGDASGSVDAITGEGLCLLFQQALALGDALAAGNLAPYEAKHRLIRKRPARMAALMLMLDRRTGLRRRTMRVLAAHPPLFARMLAMHLKDGSILPYFANTLSLGWGILTV
ncbi:MAG TPA: FAD-dependent monooxygenase [Bryobacteraceae bacterium]|nr:FAD-dependent monooxygenase [Bryobacteraceae bacterium]